MAEFIRNSKKTEVINMFLNQPKIFEILFSCSIGHSHKPKTDRYWALEFHLTCLQTYVGIGLNPMDYVSQVKNCNRSLDIISDVLLCIIDGIHSAGNQILVTLALDVIFFMVSLSSQFFEAFT